MATMNISLPDQMKAWVEEQVASGRYANTSDFIRDLIRDYQDERERVFAELRSLIQEGLDSGVSEKTPEEVREEVRAELRVKMRDDAA